MSPSSESGTFNVTIQLVAVDGGDVILEDTVSFKSKVAPHPDGHQARHLHRR